VVKSWFSTEQLSFVFYIIAITILTLFSPGKAYPEDEYRAWTGEFLRMGAGARAMGMGNAYTAVEGDIYSSYFNPAGLAYMKSKQMALSFRYLSMDRKFQYLVFGSRIGPDADFAISWISAGTDDFVGRDLNGIPTGSLSDKPNGFALTFSKILSERVSAGLNTKIAYWKLAGDYAKAFGFDLGVLVTPFKNLNASFVIRDINSRFTWKTKRWAKTFYDSDGQTIEKEDKFPVYWTAGLAYRTYGDKILLAATVENVADNPLGLNIGMAYAYNKIFSLRTGIYHYTSSDEIDSGSLTAGFTLRITGSMSFDYAYGVNGIENDNIHVVALVFDYGE